MRVGYTSIGDSEVFKSFSLTERDLEKLIADHFGFDPQNINISGIHITGGEFHVSGTLEKDDADYEESQLPSMR